MKGNVKWCIFYGATLGIILSGIILMNRTATVMAENQKPVREVCIIIDPGHGGEDGGAVSVSGNAESKYNLEISFRLQDVLHLLGYETKMTRNSDVSIYTKGETLSQKKNSDLKERVRIINEAKKGLLLSIHQNYFPDARYSGPQVFYAGTKNSELLAKGLQSVLSAALSPDSNRKAKKSSGIYLMDHIQCCGVLIECGFLSNHKEEELLRNPEYQKKLSSAIAVGVSQYLSKT